MIYDTTLLFKLFKLIITTLISGYFIGIITADFIKLKIKQLKNWVRKLLRRKCCLNCENCYEDNYGYFGCYLIKSKVDKDFYCKRWEVEKYV